MKTTSTRNEEFCSTREAAKLLDVSLRTIQLWVESGVLKAWKTAGGHRRVVRSTVQALISQRDKVLEAAHNQEKRRYRVLVVEDEPDLRKLYKMTMASWELPIDVATANDGFDALIQIGASRPDLVITDLNMPGMDGFRMTRSLRANPEYKKMHLVAVTALSKGDIQDRGGLPEGIDIFPKPVPFSKLEELVRRQLAEAHPASPA